jgi:arylsulfatase A-like enzyme
MTSFARPHSPYDAPAPYFELYERTSLPEPSVGEWASMHDVPEDAVRPDAWRGVRSDEEIRRARAGYYGSITHIDHQIGRLLFWLRRNHLLDDTMIVFASDHGDMLGDHNLWRKTYAYEGSAHVPLIVCPPASWYGENAREKRRRAVATEPVTLQDIMPTVLESVGSEIPGSVDGRSMLPLCFENGADTPWREYVHGEHCECYSSEQEMHYLTDGRMKYIWFPQLHTEQLFDLQRDPGEVRDLAADPHHADELARWRDRLVDALSKREAGLTTADGKLVSQAGKGPVVSPHYEERMQRAGIDWRSYTQPRVGHMQPYDDD